MITTQPRNTKPAIPPAVIGRTIVDLMADRVLELGMNGTAVTKDVLFEHTDFTLAEIEAHAKDACDLAKARAVRNVG